MRKPAVAGSFYAGSAPALRRQIEDCFRHRLGPGVLPGEARSKERRTLGLVSPHAGYLYSGPVAAHGFRHISLEPRPQTVVVLGPNHTGRGAAVSLSHEDRWQTPLGEVELDSGVGEAIVSSCRWAEWDDLAHAREHSVEVQLPFLQYTCGAGFRVVLITIMRQSLEVSQDLGQSIAVALKGKEGLIIASSDFTHYESQSAASRKDNMAIEAILALDPRRLAEVVDSHDITMCGPGPVMAMIIACQQMEADRASLLRYATSGDVTGDFHHVVGYASMAVTSAQ